MPTLAQLKLGLLVAGLVLFLFGARADEPRLRWIGIAFLAVAFFLRFVGRKRVDTASDEPDEPRAPGSDGS